MAIDIFGDSYAAYNQGNTWEWNQKISVANNYATPGSSEFRILRMLENHYNSNNLTIIFHTCKSRLFFPRLERDISLANVKEKGMRRFIDSYFYLLHDVKKDFIDHMAYYKYIDDMLGDKVIHLHWSKYYYVFNNGVTQHIETLGVNSKPIPRGNHMSSEDNEKVLGFILTTIRENKWTL